MPETTKCHQNSATRPQIEVQARWDVFDPSQSLYVSSMSSAHRIWFSSLGSAHGPKGPKYQTMKYVGLLSTSRVFSRVAGLSVSGYFRGRV